MADKIKKQVRQSIPDIKAGDFVKVYQIIKETARPGKKNKQEEESKKEKIQVFEGLVLARKHGNEPGATITVRRVLDGIGVERIFPLHSPTIKKIEITRRGKVRRAKLYYLRTAKGKRARLKTTEFTGESSEEIKKIPEIKEKETGQAEPVEKEE